VPEREVRVWRGLSSTGFGAENLRSATLEAESAVPRGELYFPKPFNSEQVQIIDRLEHASGVVVQGRLEPVRRTRSPMSSATTSPRESACW